MNSSQRAGDATQPTGMPNQAANREPAEGSRETSAAHGEARGNKGAEEDARRGEAGTDPVMPVDDATVNTTI